MDAEQQKQPIYLVCQRVAGLPVPPEPSVVRVCCDCRQQVWVSNWSIDTIEEMAGIEIKDMTPLCSECAKKHEHYLPGKDNFQMMLQYILKLAYEARDR